MVGCSKNTREKTTKGEIIKNNWSPIIKTKSLKASVTADYYGPFEYVKLKPNRLSTFKASISNRRESREIYNTPNFKSDDLFATMQSLPSSKRIEYFTNYFQDDEVTSTNQEWNPITHWTLQEYHPHSFSYHYHNIKFPEQKM